MNMVHSPSAVCLQFQIQTRNITFVSSYYSLLFLLFLAIAKKRPPFGKRLAFLRTVKVKCTNTKQEVRKTTIFEIEIQNHFKTMHFLVVHNVEITRIYSHTLFHKKFGEEEFTKNKLDSNQVFKPRH